jgi:hypothetical protein
MRAKCSATGSKQQRVIDEQFCAIPGNGEAQLVGEGVALVHFEIDDAIGPTPACGVADGRCAIADRCGYSPV